MRHKEIVADEKLRPAHTADLSRLMRTFAWHLPQTFGDAEG
jgi:hypothetical protein